MKKPTQPTRRKRQPAAPGKPSCPFPIVGIGASAGGLEALEVFLKHVPAASGMAFVIVQHLDPTHKGLMAELLQRATPMNVSQIKDRTRVQPNCVYVIPPNKDLSILHGVLHLLDPVTPRGLRLPIDFFFRALAADAADRSISVILSGMGSDGTLGLKAIKGAAGAVFVQDPASAKFDGMPRSAVEAGLADVVGPVETLPGRIIAYLQHIPLIADSGLVLEDKSHSAFEKVVILLRTQTGHDFSLYKKNTVYRRIDLMWLDHRLQAVQPPDLAALRNKIAGVVPLVEHLTELTQTISSSLRPGVLDDLGLVAALEWQAEDTAKRTGLTCSTALPASDIEVDGTIALAVFRIVQESLTNVVRHAQATHVSISLRTAGNVLELEIQDNGRGGAPKTFAGHKALGLIGMRERAGACGGTVDIGSEPGKGTTVRVRMPAGPVRSGGQP
jgi:hypothetical protein